MKNQIVLTFLKFFLAIQLIHQANSLCNLYPFDPIGCIQNTPNDSCLYFAFENKCIERIEFNTGCNVYLNKRACQMQLKNQKDEFVQCIFSKRCINANIFHLQNLGCADNFSKYACLNVPNKMCIWKKKCLELLPEEIKMDLNCDPYGYSVTLLACQIIPFNTCKNGYYENDFKCQQIKDEEFENLNCHSHGLNEQACISIHKSDQYCIFENFQCRSINLLEIQSCDQKLNRNACLSIQNPSLNCLWVHQSCIKYSLKYNSICAQLKDVNSSVCRIQNGLCMHDETHKKCVAIEEKDIINMPCNTKGLSKDGCLSIKQQNCVFEDVCKELSEQELKVYFCEAQLNESACINIKTEFQYCIWNGKKCERLFINQDQDCPIEFEDKEIKVNGNVCQAISKSKVSCKYNEKTHLCMLAQSNDICETPFINKTGCLSINLNNQTCQWTSQGCKFIKIIQYQTTCNSLGFANSIACSQVYENKKIGCYFNKNKEQCDSLLIEIDEQANQQIKEQNINDLRILNTINCIDQQFGLNRIACASITLEGKACLWRQDQCIYIEKASDIQNIPCLHLQFANSQICAQASFQQEPCRYFLQEKGCVNSIINNMKCDQPGLNKFSCSLATGSCYYNTNQSKCKDFDKENEDSLITSNLLDILECEKNYPSQQLCTLIQTRGQYCQWSIKYQQCINIVVKFNSQCENFQGLDILVNSNVCSRILMSFPDYDNKKGPIYSQNRGYCAYNKEFKNCVIRDEICTTKCCTENAAIGSNAHSCSRFSSQEAGVYCYFYNDRCQELTPDVVDISKPELVQQYFNVKKFSCSSLNKNSCHMLTWSKKQLCYYNGISCINVNFENYKNFEIFTNSPAILNENACLSIEATLTSTNKAKYFTYDPVKKLCEFVAFTNEMPFKTCEEAFGNRNICLRYTGNNYCKWDTENLKCVTITDDELSEINTCNYNQNIKACVENKYLACYFSYDSDNCVTPPLDVNCNYFDKAGPVTSLVCKKIKTPGQICEFKNNKCVSSTKIPSNCDIYGANITSCLKNTRIDCRWDQNSSECYNNKTDISELGCLDNLNIIMCPKITKEACFWNEDESQCQIFTSISNQQFQQLNSNNSYNLKSCLLVHGAGYYYDENTNKCIQLSNNNYKCDQYQMNEYACLYLTKTNRCYYDQNQDPLKQNKCKTFIAEQTICNSSFLINIDVCMDIPMSCIFNLANLRCQSYEVEDTTTCSFLNSLQNKGQFPNKLACSSISKNLNDQYGTQQQCYEYQKSSQQCFYEKYCYWKGYSCEVYLPFYHYYDTQHYEIETISFCTSNEQCTDSSQCKNSADPANVPSQQSYYSKCQVPQCSGTKDICNSKQCDIVYYPSGFLNDNGVFVSGTPITQTCLSYCEGNISFCTSNSDCGYIVLKEAVYSGQNCDINSCSITGQNCDDEKKCQQVRTQNWRVESKICKTVTKYVKKDFCLIKLIPVIKCLNVYSEAMCNELVEEQCFFDKFQGGCIQLQNNEVRLPSCGSSTQSCFKSQSSNAICKNGDIIQQPENCISVLKRLQICEENIAYNNNFTCSNIKKTDQQPSLCAKAMDDCRFNSQYCVSEMPIKNKDNTYNCDPSFSKSLCEKCGCDYTYLGYCQQNRQTIQINQDGSNQYYLCYLVNMLKSSFKPQACGSLSQACRYITECEDATHFTCGELIGYIVTEKACLRCQDLSTRYDSIAQKCYQVVEGTYLQQCEMLNELACLQNSRNVMCKWENFGCQMITQITENDIIDCKILNYNACFEKQVNLCWFDPDKKQCWEYNPQKGKCDLLLNKNLCDLSMMEVCQWNNNQCVKLEQIPIQVCSGLNKYACLNQVNISCGWSDERQICEAVQLLSIPKNCETFQSQNPYNLIKFNSFTCTQINIKKNCLLDKYYQCREAIITDILFCDSPGLNQEACLQRTQGNCIFKNGFCQYTNEQNLGCQTNLNKYACISQTSTCKFINSCLNYPVKQYTDIISKDINFPYSISVCTVLDQYSNFSSCFIYSHLQEVCLDISSRAPFLSGCTLEGINKYSCLTKTKVYCIYTNNQCQNISQYQISLLKKCERNLNQYACINLRIACKYVNYECISIESNDNCGSLEKQKAAVNAMICSQQIDAPCAYDKKTYSCKIVNTILQCDEPGLNEQACIFHTQGSMCQFEFGQCKFIYNNALCSDRINEDKCLNIRTEGQYCMFLDNLGCVNIDNSQGELLKCQHNFKSNAQTCSISSDIACFYDNVTKRCIQYSDPIDNINYSINYNWHINNISFNKLTCQKYNLFLPVAWQESCTIVQSSSLNFLKCESFLNKWSCISVRTPFQYCQYINSKCQSIDLSTIQNQSCDYIADINSGFICTLVKNEPCYYLNYMYKCSKVQPDQIIECVEKNPDSVGYNELACNQDKKNCYFSGQCYKRNIGGYQFCNDVIPYNQQNCMNITTEGCRLINNQCNTIENAHYLQIKCEDAINYFGCVNIQTADQFCHFQGQECVQKSIKESKSIECLKIQQINSFVFCEQPQDNPCTFDMQKNACRTLNPLEEYSCERGLNKLACLNYTNKNLMCSFLEYCYGPNNKILMCISEEEDGCCIEASSQEICLFQKKYKCHWNGTCIRHDQTDQKCDNIKNSSFQVCSSILNQFCIFDIKTLSCKSIIPQSCDEMQTPQQCNRLELLSCIWDVKSEACIFKEQSEFDTCLDIDRQDGNLKACTQVIKEGQMCIFQNNHCDTFYEQKDFSNCVNNLNKISCLQQTNSDCIWNERVYSIKKFSDAQEQKIIYGECMSLILDHKLKCDQNLSYTSCFKVIKDGQFCQWKDQKCQKIQVRSNSSFSITELSLVNQNSCGLANNDFSVSYNNITKSCRMNQNLDFCNFQLTGLNKKACQSCPQIYKWNDEIKQCLNSKIPLQIKQCKQVTGTPQLCSQINLEEPCGFVNNKCDIVDLDTIDCSHLGLNKFACLNLKFSPCRWTNNNMSENYHCEQYLPYTLCLELPSNVNQKVCSLVEDACYFNEKIQKCDIPNKYSKNCDQPGISILGCIQIEGCVFQEKCSSLKDQDYFCHKYTHANQQICKNALNKCKFDEIIQGCSPTQNEECSVKGLSQVGCEFEKNCVWSNSKCSCKAYFEEFDCESGKCIFKKCEDLNEQECHQNQFIDQKCYLNIYNQCKSASSCEDIKDSKLFCNNYTFNYYPCLQDLNYCKTLQCEILNENDCNQNKNYCTFQGSCQTKSCTQQSSQLCNLKNCNLYGDYCQDQQECSFYNSQLCPKIFYKGRNCLWIENLKICAVSACRYQTNCSGTYINQELCVKLNDDTCVSCEELNDNFCQCHNSNKYCYFDKLNYKCKSKQCQSYLTEQECPSNYCIFYNKACKTQCIFLENSQICNEQKEQCLWNDKDNKCNEKITQKTEESSSLCSFLLVISIWLMF